MSDFTPTQGRYLASIHAYANRNGVPPAEAEIAAALCVSPPSVSQMVKMLEKRGLIERQPGLQRTIHVLVPEEEIPQWTRAKSTPRTRLARPEDHRGAEASSGPGSEPG